MQPPGALSLTERFTSSDRRLLATVVAVVLLSSLYVWRFYGAAFPQASLDLTLSRDQITTKAQQFLSSRKLSTAGFTNLTLFDADDDSRLFLEREAGLEEANRLMSGDVAVWRWRARWYKPPNKEEMRVWLTPEGRLAGFIHVVEEKTPGARLDQAEARRRAESFLHEQTAQSHHLVEERREERPNRWDHVFTFERDGFNVHGATYRRTVTIQGDDVGAYREFLHVPEQWRRDFTALRSKNELYSQIAQGFYIPLILGAIIVHIQAIRRKLVPWRPLVLLCAVVGGLMVATEWNNLPFFLDSMPTSTSTPESLIIGLLQGLGAGVGVFFYVMLAAAPGETLYRDAQPQRLSLPGALSRIGIQTREFFRASIVGYGFAAFHIAFVVAFYLIGRRFGVWSPQDVEYSDLLSTSLPWLYPLTISLLASTSEEFWFRLLAIPLLKRLTGSTWIAVLVPAFVWGFLHANYPQQPGYIRGVEVGVIGIVAGLLMLRFGILATLIWHYTVDAVLIGTFLLQSPSWYFRLSGVAVAGAILFPLAISVMRYRRNGGFLVADQLSNAALAPPSEPVSIQPESGHEPLPAPEPLWPRRNLYIAAAALAAIAIALSLVARPTVYGDFIRVRLDRSVAEAVAVRALESKGAKPAEWRRVSEFLPNLDDANFEYLRRHGHSSDANAIVEQRTLTGAWRVNFFRAQQKEEWYFYIDSSGSVFRTDHTLDEKAPGANLSPADAQRIAEDYLRSKQIPLDQYRLVDSSAERRDQRTDYSFTWEDTHFKIGQATARLSLKLVGNEPSEFRRFLKLPEEWMRDYRRTRIQRMLPAALSGGIGLTLLVVFIRRLSTHPLRWRRYVLFGLLAIAVSIVADVNSVPSFYAGYDTAVPLSDYQSDRLIAFAMRTLLLGFGVLLAAMALDVFLALGLGRRPLPRPHLGTTIAIVVICLSAPSISSTVNHWIPGDRWSVPLWGISGMTTLAPSVEVLTSAFWATLLRCLLTGIVLPVAARVFSIRQLAVWLAMFAASTAFMDSTNVLQFAVQFVMTAAGAALIVFLLLTASAALHSLAAALFLVSAISGAVDLLKQPNATLQLHGAIALVASIAIAAVWHWRLRLK